MCKLKLENINGESLRRLFVRSIFIFALFLAHFHLPAAYASSLGDLMVSPTRLVFGPGDNARAVSLVNRGAEAATYRMTLKYMRMKEDGTYEDTETLAAGENSAGELLRFSPKQVTLQPGEAQKIRIMVRRPEGLADGEYRSHLLFRQVPPPSAGRDIEAPPAQDKITVKLTPVFGVSIPVIVRHGAASSAASITDVALREGELSFRLVRQGGASVHGDIAVTWRRQDGKTLELADIKGISVFPPLPSRTFSVPLAPTEGTVLRGGSVVISFRDPEKRSVLAEAVVGVP